MQKRLFTNLILLLIIPFFFLSCNFDDNTPVLIPVLPEPKVPVTVTVNFSIDKDAPSTFQNILSASAQSERSATAGLPLTIQYFVEAETIGERDPKTVTIFPDNSEIANKCFSISLLTGYTWRITVGIKDTSIDKVILKDSYDKELSVNDTLIAHHFALKPLITAGETGKVLLSINLSDDAYAVSIADEGSLFSNWNANLSTTGSTRTLQIDSIPSGIYVLKITFSKDNTIPITVTQTLTVYDNLITNKWVSGGNALINPSTGEFTLTPDIIAAANEGKKIYYVDGNSGAGNDNNPGNFNAPLHTVARAVALINAVGNETDTYKIYVKNGTVETIASTIVIGDDNATPSFIRKVELNTYQTNPTDGLGAVTITRSTAISIIKVQAGSSLTLNGGLTLDGAEQVANGILNNGTLTMNNGIIQKCYGDGVRNNSVFNLYGGSIINNKAYTTHNGGGIDNRDASLGGATLNLQGNVNVYNNMGWNGTTPSDIYIVSGMYINVTGEIAATSKICINTLYSTITRTPVQITTNYSSYNSVPAGTVFKGDLYGIREISGEAYIDASGGALTERYSDDVQITIEGPSTVWQGTGATATVTVTKNGTAISPTLTLQSFNSAGSSYNTDDYRTFSGNTLTLPDSLVEGRYTATVSTTIEGVKYSGAKTFNVVPKEVEVSSGNFNTSTNLDSVFCTGRTSVANIRSLIVSTHEVTQGEYKQYCKFGGSQPFESYGLGDNYPAYLVSWYDAILYCNLKTINDPAFGSTEAERLNHCVYSLDGVKDPRLSSWGAESSDGKYCGPLYNEWNGITFDQNADGWRLPTEAEWEYLARGGKLSTTGQTDYSGSSIIGDVAWYKVNSKDLGESSPDYGMHEVCTKAPNDLGLYDMSGNVFEWCWDWYKETSPSIDINTPATGADPSSKRVRRGGSWAYNSAECTVSARGGDVPNSRYGGLGFRVVRNAN